MSSSSLGSSNNLPTASAGGTPPSPAASQSRSASQPSSSAPPSSPTASSTPIFDRLRSLISHRSPSLSSSSSTTTAHRHSASESGGSSLSVDRGAQVESGSSRLEDLSLHERGDEVIGDVQREGQQSREAEASSSDGGDLVKTSEQRGEGPITPALSYRRATSSTLQPTSAVFQPTSFIVPEPTSTSSPPTTSTNHEPIYGLWTPAKPSSEVRIGMVGTACTASVKVPRDGPAVIPIPTLESPSVTTSGSPSPRKMTAAEFLPAEIPPFRAPRSESQSPRRGKAAKEDKKESQTLKPSASEYVPRRETAQRLPIITSSQRGEGSIKTAETETSKKELLAPEVKSKLTVPEGSVVYAEKTVPWCPPGTPGYDDYVASLTSGSTIHRPCTTNGRTTHFSHSNLAISYLSPDDHNTYALPTTYPTDLRVCALPWTSSPPVLSQLAPTPSHQQSYQHALLHLGAQSAPRPSSSLGMPQPLLSDSAAQSMSAVQHQIATYQDEVHKAIEELPAKEAHVQLQAQANRSLEESNRMLRYEHEQYKAKVIALQCTADEKEKWENRAKTGRSEKKELQRRLEVVEAEKVDVEARLEEACQELIDREDEAEERARESSFRSNSHPSSSFLKLSADTITDLERSLFESQETISRLESSLSAKEAENDDLKRKEEQLITSHEQQKSAFQRQSQAAIEQIKKNRDELAEEVLGLEKDRERLEDERGRFDAKMQVMRRKIEEEKQRRKEAERLLGARGSAPLNNAELEGIRHENIDLLASAAEASLLMDDLMGSLVSKEKENTELQGLVDGLMRDLERTQAELEELKSGMLSLASLASTPRAAAPNRSIAARFRSSSASPSVGSFASIGTSDRARAFAEQLARGKADLQTEQDLYKAKLRRYGDSNQTTESSVASLTAR